MISDETQKALERAAASIAAIERPILDGSRIGALGKELAERLELIYAPLTGLSKRIEKTHLLLSAGLSPLSKAALAKTDFNHLGSASKERVSNYVTEFTQDVEQATSADELGQTITEYLKDIDEEKEKVLHAEESVTKAELEILTAELNAKFEFTNQLILQIINAQKTTPKPKTAKAKLSKDFTFQSLFVESEYISIMYEALKKLMLVDDSGKWRSRKYKVTIVAVVDALIQRTMIDVSGKNILSVYSVFANQFGTTIGTSTHDSKKNRLIYNDTIRDILDELPIVKKC